MQSTVDSPQVIDVTKSKPSLPPKPRLAPKPFSTQKNTIRSINAPQAVNVSSKDKAGNPVDKTPPKPLTKLSTKPPQQKSTTVNTKDPKKQIKAETKPVAVQKEVAKTNHKAETQVITNTKPNDVEKSEDKSPATTIQKPEESPDDDSLKTNETFQWGGTRKRLSMELTSKFNSGGVPRPIDRSRSPSVNKGKENANQPKPNMPESSAPESDEAKLVEESSAGGSIKRRISLLFDSASKPEVSVKRVQPELVNETAGVKERIKNWTQESRSVRLLFAVFSLFSVITNVITNVQSN